LFFQTAVASARRQSTYEFPHDGERSAVTPELWLTWWRSATDLSVQRKLLEIAPRCPSVELEETLIQCLDTTGLRGQAARLLGEYGAVRAAPRLRQFLAEDAGTDAIWDPTGAPHALGDLRDNAAVPLLKAMISAYPNSIAATFAVASLGVIGTPEAEKALCELLDDGVDEDHIVPALIACGSASAMGIVVARAKKRLDGPEWLCEKASRLSWTRGWTRGRYYTHIDMTEFVAYLNAAGCPRSPEKNWDLVHAFEQIDSPDVRRLLRKWAERRGTPADAVVRKDDTLRMSYLCARELTDRGDESAIPYVLNDWADRKDSIYVQLAADDLRNFPSHAVAEEVLKRLAAADNSQATRMLALLGRFGDAADGERVRPFLTHVDDLVANVACESLLRLTDPLLVPEGWREI
jgi:HEAT repeat protein